MAHSWPAFLKAQPAGLRSNQEAKASNSGQPRALGDSPYRRKASVTAMMALILPPERPLRFFPPLYSMNYCWRRDTLLSKFTSILYQNCWASISRNSATNILYFEF